MNLAETARRRGMVLRLKRVEGQLRGIQQMIEGGQECEAIAQQLAASRKALDKAFFHLLACFAEQSDGKASRSGAIPRERMAQVARLLERFA